MDVRNGRNYLNELLRTKIQMSRLNKIMQKHKISTNQGGPNSVITTHRVSMCSTEGERQCEDGSCIDRVNLCPEEQLMNQNTILIMIVVGLAVVVFLVILYCFQQRQRRANRQYQYETETAHSDECDNESLYAPPPSYDEVIQSNMYPATPEQRRLRQLSDEPSSPMTPPPNYDTALVILAQSEESMLNKHRSRQNSLIRRSLSLDQVQHTLSQPHSTCAEEVHNSIKSTPTKSFKHRTVFRFSGRFNRNSHSTSNNGTKNNSTSQTQCQTNLITPPPYPQTPPVYPLTPPPPFTPTVPEVYVLPPSDQESADGMEVVS